MDSIKKIVMEDGRMAEQRTVVDANGDKHIELWAEEPKALKLEKRIIEKHATIVSERKIEMVDCDGQITEVKVESIDPKSNMELVHHIGLATDENSSKYVTKEDLVAALVAANEASNQNMGMLSEVAPMMSAQSVVQQNVEDAGVGMWDKVLMALVGITGLACVYVYFIM